MSKDLHVITFAKSNGRKFRENFILDYVFRLNNLQTVPFKILKLYSKENSNNGVEYWINVEDCLDEKEWKALVEAWTFG